MSIVRKLFFATSLTSLEWGWRDFSFSFPNNIIKHPKFILDKTLYGLQNLFWKKHEFYQAKIVLCEA
ncbi:hypothetical protein BGP_4184 [Beggiatoa sp. PS]|nr:hypothetical protein BGP_4184 [Beggiatoa sp. PS]